MFNLGYRALEPSGYRAAADALGQGAADTNRARFRNADYDAAFEKLLATPDGPERIALAPQDVRDRRRSYVPMTLHTFGVGNVLTLARGCRATRPRRSASVEVPRHRREDARGRQAQGGLNAARGWRHRRRERLRRDRGAGRGTAPASASSVRFEVEPAFAAHGRGDAFPRRAAGHRRVAQREQHALLHRAQAADVDVGVGSLQQRGRGRPRARA